MLIVRMGNGKTDAINVVCKSVFSRPTSVVKATIFKDQRHPKSSGTSFSRHWQLGQCRLKSMTKIPNFYLGSFSRTKGRHGAPGKCSPPGKFDWRNLNANSRRLPSIYKVNRFPKPLLP